MFVYDILGTEKNPVYQTLAAENLDRQYSFLKSLVETSLALNRSMLSTEVILALNYHAISCLHAYAGQLRPCPVTVGKRTPCDHYVVPGLMSMFVDEVNRAWDQTDPLVLAAYVLWRINYVHPFVNGNGRTARAACLYVLAMKLGGWPKGEPNLAELIRLNRPAYVAALQHAHATFEAGKLDLTLLHALLVQLLNQQAANAAASASGKAAQPATASPTTTPLPGAVASIPSTGAKPDGGGQPSQE